MKNRIYMYVVINVSLVVSTVPATADTKIFLMAGQSNMAGVGGYPGEPGYPADLPCPAPYNAKQAAVKFWNYGVPQPVGTTNQPSTGDGWDSLGCGYGHTPDEFGPEVSFGYTLHNTLFPNDDIYLVKYGISGTNLAVNWKPDGTGVCYNTFKSRVKAAIQNLTAAGKSPVIAGMIWIQGESDATNVTYAAAYQMNLQHLIAQVRNDFDTPDMPFVVGRILEFYDSSPAGGNALVRTAQQTVGDDVPNASWINTDNLQLAYEGHYGTRGQIDLGILFANEFAPTPNTRH